jgi:hypothetical protein
MFSMPDGSRSMDRQELLELSCGVLREEGITAAFTKYLDSDSSKGEMPIWRIQSKVPSSSLAVFSGNQAV